MKETMKKIADASKLVFGYGIMIILFGGGLTFFGYLAALIIGGEAAAVICAFIYRKIVPVLVYISTSLILLGLVSMYLAGEMALTGKKRK